MTPDEARELVESIRAGLTDLAERIREAYEARAWVALGYSSWAIMCQQEFGGGIQLPSGKRREVVAELASAGMSQRAIGHALNTPRTTIEEDLQVDGNRPPAPVLGLDGKRYKPPAPRPAADPAPAPPAPDSRARLGARRAHLRARRARVRDLVRALGWFTDLDPGAISLLPLADRQIIRDQCRAALDLLTD
jgi:hypothetical protein